MPQRGCLFCGKELSPWQTFIANNGPCYYEGESHYIYRCKLCNSQQDVSIETGELTNYGFMVGKYGLWFQPTSPFSQFMIKDYSDTIHGEEIVLETKYLPTKLTPQTIATEKQVGSYINISRVRIGCI